MVNAIVARRIRIIFFASLPLLTLIEQLVLAEENVCGARALKAVLAANGVEATFDSVIAMLPRNGVDSSLLELSSAAETKWKMSTVALRWKSRPPSGAPPAIIPVLNSSLKRHFISVLGWEESRVRVQDGEAFEWLTFERLRSAGWTGEVLYVAADRADVDAIKPSSWLRLLLQFSAGAGIIAFLKLLWNYLGQTSISNHALTGKA